MIQHNGDKAGGAKYTRQRRPVALQYGKEYPNQSVAMCEEYRIKQLSHIEKQ